MRRCGFKNCPTLLNNMRLGCFHLEFRAPSGSYSNNLGGIYSANGVDTHFQYCKFFGKQMSGNKYAEMHCCKKSPLIVCLNRCFLVRVHCTTNHSRQLNAKSNLLYLSMRKSRQFVPKLLCKSCFAHTTCR